MGFVWSSFDCEEDKNDYLCNEVACRLKENVQAKGRVALAVSGGKSPILFFRKLSQEDLPWENVLVCLVDERIVHPDSTDSNTNLVKTHLLRNRAGVAQFIPMLDTDINSSTTDDFSLENLRYEDILAWSNKNFIQPDIVILGMGVDGHIASLFPGPKLQEYVDSTENIILTEPTQTRGANNPPYNRLSLSLRAIKNSREVFLSLQGKNKKEIFDIGSADFISTLPISHLIHSEGVLVHVCYTD